MIDDSNRRLFLERAYLGALALSGIATQTAQCAGANDKIVVGLIGCGGRGTHDAGLFHKTPNVEVTCVCDVDQDRRGSAAKSFGLDSKRALSDLRRMLDDRSIDAVIVATPDHWHSPAAILACEAGKHVYVEKPISHNLREGRLLVDASTRNKTLVQHGTQSRSTSMIREAVQQLHGGVIGDVLMAKCWNVQRRGSLPPGKDTEPPAGFDYENWVGPATMIPYRTNRVHNRWTMWYHFGAGDMGNDGVHDIDYTRWGLGVDTHPVKVTALGGKYVNDDESEFPDTQQVTFEYAPDQKTKRRRLLVYEQRLWSTNYPHNTDSGAEFYGTKGQMFISRRGKVELLSDRNAKVELDIKPQGQDDAAHVQNFCDSIRGTAKLNADALTGHLSTALCHLGNIATRLGRSLDFDPAKEQVVDDSEANALLRREYREHWGTPKNV